jgi:CubicO group peptidase (beta-lactamase class C family)
MPPATLSTAAHLELDNLLEQAVARRDLPLVVAVVANRNAVIYRGAVGATPASIFRLASLTKPVTSVAVMMLRERGLLDLDDPLEQYLPEYAGRKVIAAVNAAEGTYTTRAAARPITLRHLLTHTAGFGYDFSNETVWTLCRDGTHLPHNLPLLFDPGSRWAYSCATAILADVITQITGEPFYHFFDTQILQPLGMAETSYFLDAAGLARLLPLHFRAQRDWVKDPNTRPHEPYVAGDGGLLGTMGDYIRFLQMLLNEGQLGETRLLSAQSVREMTSNQIGALTVETQQNPMSRAARPFPFGGNKDTFGLGFQLKAEDEANMRPAGSYSWGGVFNTHFWNDPHNGLAALLCTQLLPYYDEQVMAVLAEFEKCIYRHLV